MRLKFRKNFKQIWVNTHLEAIDLFAHLITFARNSLCRAQKWPRNLVEVKKNRKMPAKSIYICLKFVSKILEIWQKSKSFFKVMRLPVIMKIMKSTCYILLYSKCFIFIFLHLLHDWNSKCDRQFSFYSHFCFSFATIMHCRLITNWLENQL